ncbi:hypothetical protein ZEAMMB73_Zm00001d015335 [Zea mays]|uniref:Xylanase inhibitor N-terminal domain-containing protein n=1 Tax=Zea mays TaxID=4577 RepID=A0A1D6H1E2_MAIZE|nr:hypothetical protein ZEAMMB73_Zm00001d015335 [Zea mays]
MPGILDIASQLVWWQLVRALQQRRRLPSGAHLPAQQLGHLRAPSPAVPGLLFGCSSASAGDYSSASGVFGFSRGPLSLVSQLQIYWFSYFWASDSDGSSWFGFGFDSETQTKNSRSTPLIPSVVTPYSETCAQLSLDVEAPTAAASSPHSLVSHTTKILCLLAAWLLLF